MSKHLKRFNAPKSWMILRKTTKYIAKPLPGAHKLSESMPIVLVLKQLGHAKTSAEAKKLLHNHQVLVDGRRVRALKMPVGLLDSISLPTSKEHYRIIVDEKERLQLVPIPKAEAGIKLCKVVNKTMVEGGKTQLNLNDGRNILADSETANTGDTLMIEVPGQKILQRIPLEKGALVFLLGGKHIGTLGTVEKIENDEITFMQNGRLITTAKKYALVVGKEKPLITITKAQ
ncbi:MAG: 30S ribosomal protein S4e [Candidatus Woesearchaeota archaeon]